MSTLDARLARLETVQQQSMGKRYSDTELALRVANLVAENDPIAGRILALLPPATGDHHGND